MVLTAVILARVYWVGTDTTYAASAGRQTTQTTELPRARGNFLDRTDRPLTGTDTTRYALCVPGDNSYSALLPYVSYQAQTLLYERRNSTSPFLVEIGKTGAPANVLLLDQPRRTLPSPIAVHLLGYLDQEGRGVTGLERAWDAVLANSCDQTAAVCRTTARGRLLGTGTPEIEVEQQGTDAQVQLTLDADIQRLCEGLAQLYMPRGCILVMDTATGEVLASVSMPEYDPDDVPAASAPMILHWSTGRSPLSAWVLCSRWRRRWLPTRMGSIGSPMIAPAASRWTARPTAAP